MREKKKTRSLARSRHTLARLSLLRPRPAHSPSLHATLPHPAMRTTLAPARRPGLAPTTARRAACAPLAAKPTKAADFRALSEADIDAAVAESKRALFDMRIAQRTRQVREEGRGRRERERGGGAWRGAARRRGGPGLRRSTTPQAPPLVRSRHKEGPMRCNAGRVEGRRRSGRQARTPRLGATAPLSFAPRPSSRVPVFPHTPTTPHTLTGVQTLRLWLAQDQDRAAVERQAGAHPRRGRQQARVSARGESGKGGGRLWPVLNLFFSPSTFFFFFPCVHCDLSFPFFWGGKKEWGVGVWETWACALSFRSKTLLSLTPRPAGSAPPPAPPPRPPA